MKNKQFIAVNLNEFHANQSKGETKAQMVFVSADNLEKAKEFVKIEYPNIAWTIICKDTFDKNIVYK